MSTTPAAADLPPNENIAPPYEAGIIASTVIAVTVCWLRMYVRGFMINRLWWDDWIMFGSSFFMILANGFSVAAYETSIGKHIYYLSPENISKGFMYYWIVESTNLFSLYGVRVAISLTFLRIIPPSKIWLRKTIWATIISLTVADIYVSVIFFAQCGPVRKIWEPTIEGWCLPIPVQSSGPWLYIVTSVVVDFVITGIALWLFSRLKVNMKTKVVLCLLCSLGLLTCACSIVKVVLLPSLFTENPDKTFAVTYLLFWAAFEIPVGMICGCIAALKPLFGKVFSDSNTETIGRNKNSAVGSSWFSRSHTPGRRHQSVRLDSLEALNDKIEISGGKFDEGMSQASDHSGGSAKGIVQTTKVEWMSTERNVDNSMPENEVAIGRGLA